MILDCSEGEVKEDQEAGRGRRRGAKRSTQKDGAARMSRGDGEGCGVVGRGKGSAWTRCGELLPEQAGGSWTVETRGQAQMKPMGKQPVPPGARGRGSARR